MLPCNYCVIAFFVCFTQNVFGFEISTKCEPPSNLQQLPIFAQEEIREIWKSHAPGTPCIKQKEVEADIFDVVKSFESEPNNEFNTYLTTDTPDLNYDQIAANGGAPIPLLATSSSLQLAGSKKERSSSRIIDDEEADDYLDKTTFDDVAMLQFDNVNAPFLRTVDKNVKREFEKVWQDPDIPSESLRALKIQTLAVSLLTSSQLTEYNKWATKRRRVLKAREQEMRNLSYGAKETLRKMSSVKFRDPDEQIVVPATIKDELLTFVEKLNRRRNLKIVV